MKPDPDKFLNRELSWLEFNQRVLDEASNPANPLLERLRFLAITASNLDEFFMVRVGSLRTAQRRQESGVDPSGQTPTQQLESVAERVHEMVERQYRTYLKDLEPALARIGIRRRHLNELTPAQSDFINQLFDEEIFSTLTPVAIHDPEHFPLLPGGTINVAVQLSPSEPDGDYRYAVIPFGRSDLRFIRLPSENSDEFVFGEDVVAQLIQRFFPGEEIVSTVAFRNTRNADLSVREDEGTDLLAEMEDVLEERKDSFCVRLEISDAATAPMVFFLKKLLKIRNRDVYVVPGPAGLKDLMSVANISGYPQHVFPEWKPSRPQGIEPGESIFDAIRLEDHLLYHPYESFDPVVQLIEEAADDPDVVAIKQTLYRTSRDSPIVSALMRAAEKDKNVSVIVELKARFDEARNIEWARRMELAGVQVIYGVRGLKTHAKACVVVRREPQGFVRYCHFGTGNYNEATANLYTDISYLTCNDELGHDVISWFNATTGYSQLQSFQQLESAPISLRERLMELIEFETQRARNKAEAAITAKFNSLVDPKIINALYKASQAGVRIQLNVRGICCLKPGVPGLSENIRVVSIVGRYLEHARIFHFLHGGENLVFLSSADVMPRNLDRRIELLVPIIDRGCRRRVIQILKTCMKDTAKARVLLPDGSYRRPSEDGTVCSQSIFQEEARNMELSHSNARLRQFVPLKPGE